MCPHSEELLRECNKAHQLEVELDEAYAALQLPDPCVNRAKECEWWASVGEWSVWRRVCGGYGEGGEGGGTTLGVMVVGAEPVCGSFQEVGSGHSSFGGAWYGLEGLQLSARLMRQVSQGSACVCWAPAHEQWAAQHVAAMLVLVGSPASASAAFGSVEVSLLLAARLQASARRRQDGCIHTAGWRARSV